MMRKYEMNNGYFDPWLLSYNGLKIPPMQVKSTAIPKQVIAGIPMASCDRTR
jgi:hypothetical protein